MVGILIVMVTVVVAVPLIVGTIDKHSKFLHIQKILTLYEFLILFEGKTEPDLYVVLGSTEEFGLKQFALCGIFGVCSILMKVLSIGGKTILL